MKFRNQNFPRKPNFQILKFFFETLITGVSTVGRSKQRMTGKERRKAAQKARKKLVKEMDLNVERAESRAGSLTRSGSRSRLDGIDLNAKRAGADFAMDQLSARLNGMIFC